MMRKHPNIPLYLIVGASLAVLTLALVILIGPGGPLDLTQPIEPAPRLAGR